MGNKKIIFIIVLLCICWFWIGWYFGQHGVPFLKKQQEWSIGIYQGDSPFELSSNARGHDKIINPVLTKEDVTDIEALFVADPFMIDVNSTWYMFFEVKNGYDYGTDLAYAISGDGIKWEYQKVILNELFALSYPFVFESDGNYYMIPETYQTNSIRLYKAINFPTQWQLQEILIEGKDYVDSTIFRYDGKWWIFTSTTNNDNLYLYYTDTLEGTWNEHPMSPIIEGDRNIARPGGRVIEFEGSLYRFAQDDEPRYGNQVWAFKIKTLNIGEYVEEKVVLPVLTSSGIGWNEKGMHTLDAHELNDGSWIAAVDGYKTSIVWED